MTHIGMRSAAISSFFFLAAEHYLFLTVSKTGDVSPVDDSEARTEFAKPKREISDLCGSVSLPSWFLAQSRGGSQGS